MMNKLYRSSTDRVFAGVCGGLGEYLKIDSSLIRILWVLSVLLFGFGVLLYIISAILIPLEPMTSAEKKRGYHSPAPSPAAAIFPFLVGIFLLLVGISALGHNLGWDFFRWYHIRSILWIIFPALFIILGLALIFRTLITDHEKPGDLPDPDAKSYRNREPEMKKTAEKKTDTNAYSKPPKSSEQKQKTSQSTQPRKLYRNMENRMISGVCSGIADYINLDVSIVRLIWVILTIMSAGIGGLLIYFILVLIVPVKE